MTALEAPRRGELFAEQVRLLYEQGRAALVSMPLVAVTCAALLWGRLSGSGLVAWLVAIGAVTLIRGLLILVRATQSSPSRPAAWANAYAVVEGLSGLAWFGLAWISLGQLEGVPQTLVLLALGFMVIGAMPMLVTVLRTFLAFLLGLGVPLTVFASQLQGEAGDYLPWFSLCFQVAMALTAVLLQQRVVGSLRLGLEHRSLLEAMEKHNRALAEEVETRKRAEEEARAATSRFERLARSTREGVLLCAVGRVVDANPQACALLGRPLGSLVGVALRELLPAEPEEEGREHPTRRYTGAVATEDGPGLQLEITRGTDADQEIVTLRDVTAQQRVLRLKDEFVSNVSHELRTPVTSARGAIELLTLRQDELDAEQREFLGIAARSTEQLAGLVEDLLDFQRLGAGALSLRLQAVSVQQAIQEAVDLHRPFAAEFRVRLEASEPLPSARVMACPKRLGQVIGNLLDNGAKYGPEDEVVRVAAKRAERSVEFEVSDAGPGVPNYFLAQLFEPFTQADGGATRQRQGSGLGLSICKQLVELHGGTLSYERRDERTVFRFDIPMAAGDVGSADGSR